MNPICKPYVPDAETPPPVLNGLGFVLNCAWVALAHTKLGRFPKNVVGLLSE